MAANLAAALFGLVAIFRGQHWMLRPEEQSLIGQTGGEALKLVPESERVGPWLAIVTAIGAVMTAGALRYAVDLELKRQRQAGAAPAQHTAPAPEPGGSPTSAHTNGARPPAGPDFGFYEQPAGDLRADGLG